MVESVRRGKGVVVVVAEEHWESATSVGCRSSGLCVYLLYMWGGVFVVKGL